MKKIFKKVVTSILLWESKMILKKYNPYVISITGSVGKTSTKDAIFTALSSSDYVRRSDKSFNSEIGIPLTIIGCNNGWSDPIAWINNIFQGLELIVFKSDYPKTLVLEVGADHPHDIESVSKWLQSDVVVMNKVGDIPVHVEFFASAEEVLKEKSFLIKTLKPNGTLVLFADDKKVSNLAQGVKQTVMTFGINEMASVTASNIAVSYDDNKVPNGMSFKINNKGNSIPMKIMGTLGSQQIYPIIAAITVGISKGISIPKMIDAFDKHSAPKGRMNILKGMNDSTIIDDTYNASPDALREGLITLASLQVAGKRIAVIGDMMELGNFSAEEHRKAGILAIQSSDVLVTVGPRAKVMSDRAIAFNDSVQAGEYLKTIISSGDVIYVKGSQSIRMERTVKLILEDPSLAPKLLVRQEKEWLEKK